ncbi:glycosyltransferase family 9 protein [Bacteroidota bacterium]
MSIVDDIYCYCKNSFVLIQYKVLIFFLKSKKSNEKKSILFINTGQIGDLMVSSLILDNDEVFGDVNVYLIIKQKYLDLFQDYKGKVKIIVYNYKKYKWSFFYKIKFLNYLQSLNSEKCFNVTSARGMLNDEMSLLSGASEVYCLNSNWRYLKKAFRKRMDSEYTGVLYKDKNNEYAKHSEMLNHFKKKEVISVKNKKVFNVFRTPKLFGNEILNEDDYITVAPLPSDVKRGWGIKNFRELCKELSINSKVVLLGSNNDRKILDSISESNRKIINTAGLLKIYEVPSVISKSKLFIGNDSGLTHIALKLNIPMIAIIGGGNYGKFFPFVEKNSEVVYLFDKMDCFGCEWDCIYRERYCITNVSLTDILNSMRKLLKAETKL